MTGCESRLEAITPEGLRVMLGRSDGMCPFQVTRRGDFDACDKPAVALVAYRWEGEWFVDAACLYHAHQMGREAVVPLVDVLAAIRP